MCNLMEYIHFLNEFLDTFHMPLALMLIYCTQKSTAVRMMSLCRRELVFCYFITYNTKTKSFKS
jgi:hypothetical protein